MCTTQGAPPVQSSYVFKTLLHRPPMTYEEFDGTGRRGESGRHDLWKFTEKNLKNDKGEVQRVFKTVNLLEILR